MILISLLLLTLSAKTAQNHLLKDNYQLQYTKKPKKVKTLKELFSQGEFYGRLRSHTFMYEWEKEKAQQDNHLLTALGSSFIFKSASMSHFDITAGFYFTHAYLLKGEVSTLKSAKDTFSRFDSTNDKGKSLAVLGQAYLHYRNKYESEFRLGRQIVETFYTKSNDSKMIPNTFDGVVLDTKFDSMKVRLTYLLQQKLRDHAQFHAVLAYGDSTYTTARNPQFSENDDAAMHKGLTVANLVAAGLDPDAALVTADIAFNVSKDTKLDIAAYTVKDLLSQVMAEVNYKVSKSKTTKVTAGIRYIRQIDKGAGEIGGASLEGKAQTAGYEDPDSLESQMLAARMVTQYKNYSLNLGLSYVSDEADLVTPWRGFPTAGYTRSMARYNWEANTKSYRILLKHAASKTKNSIEGSFLHTDADENKGEFDQDFYYLGCIFKTAKDMDLSWRLRLGYTDSQQTDADSLDGRLEINYLF